MCYLQHWRSHMLADVVFVQWSLQTLADLVYSHSSLQITNASRITLMLLIACHHS